MTTALLGRARRRLLKAYDLLRIRRQKTLLPPATPRERELAAKLGTKLGALEIPPSDGMSPAQKAWNENMRRLQGLAASDDPRNFLSWEVVGGTMFVRYAKYSRTEYAYLAHRTDWSRWQAALVEHPAGNPVRCPFDTRTSCNLVHHAYHLAQFEDVTGTRVDGFRSVIEFGGGYGSMCRLFANLGFRGRYLIIDLPAFTALQEYYLESIGIRILTPGEYRAGEHGVLCLSDLDALRDLVDGQSGSLFLATWSISEAPLPVRQQVLDGIADSFDACLIAYQPRFEDVDNTGYFSAFSAARPGYAWQARAMDHLPGQTYLFGLRHGARDAAAGAG